MKSCYSRKQAFATVFALVLACVMAFKSQAQQIEPGLVDVPTNDSQPIQFLLGPPVFVSKDIADTNAAADAASPVVSATAAIEPQDAVPSQMAQILNQHNTYRAQHGAGPLTWNTVLASQSASWAQGCNFKHSQPNGLYGENLALTSARGTAAIPGALLDSINGWYDEVRVYNYSNPGFSMATGHFTQVVWKSSTLLGCGLQDCPTVGSVSGFRNGGTLVVCRYKPAGNFEGQYTQNVLPAQGGGGNPNPNPSPNFPPYNPNQAIPSGQSLQAGRCLTSSTGKYRLCLARTGLMQVQYSPSAGRWRTNWNNGVSGPSNGARPFRLSLLSSGNLVAWDARSQIYWQTRTAGSGTAPFVLILKNSGNVMLYDSKGACLWGIKGRCAIVGK